MVGVPVVQDGGRTALHRAASSGHMDAVKALLAGGANVTARDVRCGARGFKMQQAFELGTEAGT
jgi:hypothetical protein